MLLVLAAVPQETSQLRAALYPCSYRRLGPYPSWHGRRQGQDTILVHSGIGMANAAAATALALHHYPGTTYCCNLGCAGALPHSRLHPGDLVVATQEHYAQAGLDTEEAFVPLHAMPLSLAPEGFSPIYNDIPLDHDLCSRAFLQLQPWCSQQGAHLVSGISATVASGSGSHSSSLQTQQRSQALCENMEGAAIAHMCVYWQRPLLELRGISNYTGPRQHQNWHLELACQRATNAFLQLVDGGLFTDLSPVPPSYA